MDLLESRLYDSELQRILCCLYELKGADFLSYLIHTISPIKAYRLKRRYYPVEHLDELQFLKSINSELSVTLVEIAVTKNITEIEQNACGRSFFGCLTDKTRKDLYGLGMLWQSEWGYKPLIMRKDYADILPCDPASLSRHYHEILKGYNDTISKNDCNETPTPRFVWDEVTGSIPPRENR